MCRWNAYLGQPILVDDLLHQTQHGLIDQSLHSRMGVETTNGEGFGMGWWIEVPEATALIVQPRPDEHRPFRPQAPERQAAAMRSPAAPGASSASR